MEYDDIFSTLNTIPIHQGPNELTRFDFGGSDLTISISPLINSTNTQQFKWKRILVKNTDISVRIPVK